VSAEEANQGGDVPRHLAIICDGNGRWARARKLSRRKGHEQGAKRVRLITDTCVDIPGIQQLTFYALSYDNLHKRPRTEVAALFRILRSYLRKELPYIMDGNIRFTTIGEIEEFPKYLQREIDKTVSTSAANTGMGLCLALNYSGRREITNAAREIARSVKDGKLSVNRISVDDVSQRLFTAHMPDVDLLLRSGGDMRVSDFLLWQISYAEIYVTDTLWPDFREPQLDEALEWFAGRHRRFGAVKET